MTQSQQIITIALVALATMITRFLPFLAFPADQKTPAFVQYLGDVLPSAVFGLLVVYCLRNVDVTAGSHGIPEIIAAGTTAVLYLWKKNMLVSIAGGTIVYMLLVQMVF